MTIFDLLPNNPFRSRRVSDVESRVAEPVITSTNAVGNKPVVHDGGEVLLVYSSNEKVLPIYKINQKINTTSRKLNRLAMISKYLFVILFFNFIAAYTSIAYVGLRHDQLDTSITKACVNGCNSTKVVGINARSLKVGGTPGDAFTLIKLGKLYENRTAEHNAFMDAHLPALLEEVTNITTTVANAVGFSAPELTDLPSALDSATSFAGQMDVIRNLLLELAAVPDAGSPQPSGLLELTQSLVDHFMDINNESDDYEKFVSNLNSTINEFKESHPAFSNLVVVKPDGDDTEPKTLSVRSLTLFNSTSTSPGGPVPAMNDILDSLFPGSIEITLGVNLAPAIKSKILVCDVTYFFAWELAPEVPVTGAELYILPIPSCNVLTYKEADVKGVGVTDKGWKWFDTKHRPVGKSGALFTFGERNVGKVNWDWQ